MKNLIFFIIIFSFIQINIFPNEEAYDPREYLMYVSFGYNAVETAYDDGDKSTDFYMLNNPLYSNVRIMDFDYGVEDTSLLSPILGSTRYHLMAGYIENDSTYLKEWPLTNALKHYYDYYRGGYTGPEGAGFQYKTENGKMVSAWYIHRYREGETYADSIKYRPDGSVIVDFGRFTMRFYNIPEKELIKRYLTAFTQATKQHLNRLDDEALQGRTKEELAIIRNCLFAKYNYNFQTKKWKVFMTDYYDKNYKGINSNQEVMNMLNEREKKLLERIIYYENK
jgi:hypothetical protein